MASTKDENNWGGMAPSSKKLTTSKPKTSTAKKTTTTKKTTAKPVVYGRGGAYAPAAKSGAFNFGSFLNDYFSGVKERIQSGTADTGKLPTSKSSGTGAGASVIGNYKANSGTSKTTTPVFKPAGGGGGVKTSTPKYMTPDQLFVDPTPAYQPVLDYLAKQETAAKKRYDVNAANIKTIFGNLTGLTAEDSARITKQFTDSLATSKADLASRTAEARQGSAAGVQQAVATGAERGEGPAMAVNPVQVAAEEGIARSNEYATTWQALQAANQQQAMADISARGAGYGQQEIGAIQQLAQSLEDRLLAIGGNTAQVQSDIAQAKFSQEKDIQQVKFQLSEQAKQAAAQAAAAASAKPTYSKDIFGLKKRMKDAGIDFTSVAGEVSAAYEAAYKKLNTLNGQPRTTSAVKPSAAEVKAAWNAQFGTKKTAPYAQSYIDLQF